MAGQSAWATGTPIDGAINDCAINEMTPVVETIQAFARDIAQMSEQALVRTNHHLEKLRKADRIEEAAAIQADFLEDSMEHAVQHTRMYIEFLATFPPELVQPVNEAVKWAMAARDATTAKVERLYEVIRND